MEDAASNRTSYSYDSLGRRIAVTDALSNSTHTAYDGESRVVGTWGATYPVAYEYDAFGRMSAMYTYRGTNSIASYTDLSNLKSEMDRTAWQYDQATGLLTNKLYADGKGTAYSYAPDGRLSRRTWARGVTTDYSYDSIGQLTNINFSDSTPDVSFSYDRLGRQVTIADGTGTRSFAYDAALQLASEICNQQSEIARRYDALGRPAGFSLITGDSITNYAVSYAYDLVGRFSSVDSSINHEPSTTNHFSYSYLPGSDLLSGISNRQFEIHAQREYEPNRDLLTQVLNAAGTNLVSRFDYANDAVGRRTLRLDSLGSLPLPLTNAFAYNARSELEDAAMGTNTFNYAYDPIGNRRSASEVCGLMSNVSVYAANALNQYTNISDGVTNAPTYDADGNLLSYGGWTFSWDAENRLVAAANGSTVVSNAYDYMSRRVSKSVFTNDTGSWILASDSSYSYDGWAMISEISNLPSEMKTNVSWFVYGLDLSGTLQGAGTIGGILCNLRSSVSNTSCAFYAYDGNGNVTDLVDTNVANVAHYEYDPYGNLISEISNPEIRNPFKFSTKYLDSETGLYYYGLRFYSAGLGRWLSRDPIGEMAGVSLYRCVNNDLIDRTDLLGLILQEKLDPPETSEKCGKITAGFAATAWGLNWTLWQHWLSGSGKDMTLSMNDFDFGGLYRALAFSGALGKGIGLAQFLACGGTGRTTYNQSKPTESNAITPPWAWMIFKWRFWYECDVSYGKWCFCGLCGTYAKAKCSFHALDEVNFWAKKGQRFPLFLPSSGGLPAVMLDVSDDLVLECFPQGKGFDVTAGSDETKSIALPCLW